VLWHLGRSNDELAQIGSTIGADVPLFFDLPAAHVEGMGERVSPVEFAWDGWIVLARPAIDVSTPVVYSQWREGDRANDINLRGLVDSADSDASSLSARLVNALEPAAFRAYPALAAAHRQISEIADRPVRMTGSGSGLFTLFDGRAEAEAFAARIRSELSIRAWLLRLWAQSSTNRSAS
jgi:4-diphosphocytidyl-2-C-methyl-D-erythritol kinase